MKPSVIVFPASNCDRDAAVALEQATGKAPKMVWHGESDLPDTDFIVLPGGFSYGDYLRSGAMAARSPIMRAIVEKAKAGTPVIGICNGFQILTETGLLPGALLRNAGLDFVCRTVALRYRARNFPNTLSATEAAHWAEHRRARLIDGEGGALTVQALFDRIDTLAESADDERSQTVLEALYEWGEMMAPEA